MRPTAAMLAFMIVLLGVTGCRQNASPRPTIAELTPTAAALAACSGGAACATPRPIAAAASSPSAIAALAATPSGCPPVPCDATIEVTPAQTAVAPGGTVTVSVEATPRPTVQIGTFIIEVAYDPTVLKPLRCDENLSRCEYSFQHGPIRLVGATSQALSPAPSPLPAQNTGLPAQLPAVPVRGVPLAEITFEAIGAVGTTSALSPTIVSLVDPNGQPDTTSVSTATISVQNADAQSPVGAVDLAFADPLHGWALGIASLCPHGGCSGQAALWTTADGGASWLRQALPQLASGGLLEQEQHMLFLNQQDGFLYGPDLYATHDGGQTWETGPGMDWLQLVTSGSRLLALTDDCTVAAANVCSKQRTAYVSDDIGRSWSKLADPPPVGVQTLLSAPASTDLWWFSTNATTLYHSGDNGQSWQFVGLTPPCGWPLPTYAEGRIWLVCKGQGVQGSEFRAVNVSDDGGATWQQVVSPTQASSGFSRAIAAASHGRAFIIGSRTGLLTSKDGGSTWQLQLPDYGGNGFQAVSFLDGAHGWALHGRDEGDPPGTIATVWRTTDGGTTWTAATLP